MSLQRACCCGEPTICSVCSCATSYRVNGINLSYSFTFNKASPGASCVCRYREYDISVNIVPTSRVIATKEPGCCYRARFYVSVTGSVNLRQYYDSTSYCPPVLNYSNTYSFTRTTCACLTVRCETKVDTCGGPSRANVLVHTIEIGDFIVNCNAEVLTSGDCDSCPTQGVFALKCIGGRFQFVSNPSCLNSLSNVAFMGFYGNTQQWCGITGPISEPGACFANLESNIFLNGLGPFSLVLESECAEGVDDYNCTDSIETIAECPTFAPLWPETLRTELQGPCGSVDWSGTLAPTGVCVNDIWDVLQGGAPGFWTYV